MQFTHILGIDVSKKKIDLALSQNKTSAPMISHKVTNNPKGYQALLQWLKKQNVEMKQVLICLENTGIYHRSLVDFLDKNQAFVWVENAVEIKWSGGLQRGKNDKIDGQRICLYALRNQDKAQAYTKVDKSLQDLQDLLSTRERLIQAKNALSVPIKEMREMDLEQQACIIEKACQGSIATLEKDIKAVEKELERIVQQDKKLKHNYQIVRSVRSVGLVTTLYLLVYTHNFTRFSSSKKLASYSGIAPFSYSSGTSIRGKNKVHPMANKVLKTALHMCALSSISHNEEMKQYYQRKVKEGKNKMSVLNAIRNKILHIIFACVRDQKMYVYQQVA